MQFFAETIDNSEVSEKDVALSHQEYGEEGVLRCHRMTHVAAVPGVTLTETTGRILG